MKNVRLFALLLIVFVQFSCEKEVELQSQITFEEQFLNVLDENNSHENVIIFSGYTNNQLQYQVVDGFEYAWSGSENNRLFDAPGDELCRGTGLAYAKCAKKALDDGKCLKAYKDGDEYVAEEIVCDDTPGFQP
jgi:hypothetical protein